MGRMSKLNFFFNKDKFEDFIRKLDDLSKISNTVKLKIDNDDILMYTVLGDSAIYAFKNYTLNTSDYLVLKDDLECTFDLILDDIKKVVKNFKFFNCDSHIKSSLSYKESGVDNVMYVRTLKLNDNRFSTNHIGSEPFKIRDISKTNLNIILDERKVAWSFDISKEDFMDIKKLASINNEEKIISIYKDGNDLKFGESSKWDLKVGEISEEHGDIIFIKKYLNSVNIDKDIMTFKVFPSFLLYVGEDTNLMMAFEQKFDDDDE